VLAPTAAGGSTWLVLTLAVAAGAVAVALLLRNAPSNAKAMVLGFEAVALVVGGLGLAGGHYIPGTIIGVITFVTALNMPAASAAPAEVPAPVAAVAPAPGMDNPYATPAPLASPVTANAYAPPAPIAPPAPVETQVEAVVPPQAPPAPVETPEPATPMRPEDIPPAPRAMTILPGQ